MTSVLESILTLPPLKFFPLAVVTLMGQKGSITVCDGVIRVTIRVSFEAFIF